LQGHLWCVCCCWLHHGCQPEALHLHPLPLLLLLLVCVVLC
jgi:hypothetical protein